MRKEPERPGVSTRQAFGEAIVKLGERNDKLVVLDGDISRSTYTVEFGQRFPFRHINVGIAEQNQMGMAAGLALAGLVPVVASYAVFVSMRAVEQLRTSICYPKLNVKIAASHGGLTPGNDGATHQGIEDMGLMRTIPNMTVIMPADRYSLEKLLPQACEWDGPVYIRLTRDAVPLIYDETDCFEIGRAKLLRSGGDVTIIAVGDMLQWALDAADILEEEGISSRVVDMHTIKPLDEEAVLAAAEETGAVVTVEDHNIYNGLGSAVAEVLVENRPTPMKRIGIRDRFGESGPYEALLKKHRMSTADICQAVRDVVARKSS